MSLEKILTRIERATDYDPLHQKALDKTGFWGKRGAGCIFLAASTKRFCISHRSLDVEQPGTWGTWGGAIDPREKPERAVLREIKEEAGYIGKVKLVPLLVFRHASGFVYHNFLAITTDEFRPEMDWENQNFAWREFGNWPKPMHPGLKALLADPESLNIMRRASMIDDF